jgi:hypothetical protein
MNFYQNLKSHLSRFSIFLKMVYLQRSRFETRCCSCTDLRPFYPFCVAQCSLRVTLPEIHNQTMH